MNKNAGKGYKKENSQAVLMGSNTGTIATKLEKTFTIREFFLYLYYLVFINVFVFANYRFLEAIAH